jgi:hypothetical protein
LSIRPKAAEVLLPTVLVLGLVLAAAGCAAANDANPATPPTWSQYAGEGDPASREAASTAAAQPAGPPVNDRGNIEKALGETGGLTNTSDDQVAMEFAVQAIKIHKGCAANTYRTLPAGMKPISLDIVANTHDDPDNLLQFVTVGHGWEYIAPDGTSFNANETMSCTYESADLKPNRKYTVTVWLLVPADAPTDGTATLVWNPSPALGLGYEWKLTA